MKYHIVSDLSGRLRVRCGKYAFAKEEGDAIVLHLSRLPWVESAKASYINGSILVFYSKGFRRELLSALSVLRLRELAPAAEAESMQSVDMGFKERLYRLLLRRAAQHFLVPAPLRNLIYLWRGFGFLRRGWACLRHGHIGVEVLDGAAVGVSLLQGNFSTASSIMFLLGLSELLEDYTRQRTRNALTQSLAIHVNTVWVERHGAEYTIPLSRLAVGDKVIVRTGSMIPTDGKVLDGEASVNQSSMTGEPLPVLKGPGDSVFAGTVLEEGCVTVEVRTLSSESRINKVVELIDRSEGLKAGVQAKAERIADSIVPFSFLLAVGVFVFMGDWRKALSVLLVDYSCAIKLATPIAVISAMREASTHKIMVKGGKFLEAMAEADTVVFDKTGTLTDASPQVSRVIPFDGHEHDEVLRTAACLEEHFPHSVARAVVRKALEENLHHEEEHAEVHYIVAHGIATTYNGKRVVIGSHHFVVEDESVTLTSNQEELVEKSANGDSVIYLGVDGRMIGAICINDPLRAESRRVITRLKELGIRRVIMLTGDGEATARAVAETLGVDSYRSQVLPENKATIVEELKSRGHRVIMVGDGINDSPALAAADVSVSMKGAADIAREVADITLLTDKLDELVTVRVLSQQLMLRIRNNFRFIVSFNTALLLLGLSGSITPNLSAILHNTSTMGISAASMRSCLKERKKAAADCGSGPAGA